MNISFRFGEACLLVFLDIASILSWRTLFCS